MDRERKGYDSFVEELPGDISSAARRQRLYRRRNRIVKLLREIPTDEHLWEAIVLFQGYPFETVKGLKFSYRVKESRKGDFCNEIIVDRKEKSITRSSVEMAFHRVQELDRVTGPKQLKVFGASYLYPVFIRLGMIAKRDDCANG